MYHKMDLNVSTKCKWTSAQTNTGKMQEKRTYSLKCGRRCAIVEIQIFIRKTQV